MSDVDRKFHEEWLGLIQPHDGLVFSVPVLTDAGCAVRHPPEAQRRLRLLLDESAGGLRLGRLAPLFDEVLGLRADLFDAGAALPDDLSLWVPEGRQRLVPTLALRRRTPVDEADKTLPDESTPQSRAGAPYLMLVWELPDGLAFDRPETVTGEWHYPPAAKLERLLRACRVPMGLISNGRALRLLYAPHGESLGALTFPIEVLASVGGRPVFDALLELLSAPRIFRQPPIESLVGLMQESRKRQASVTNELAEQVYGAVEVLLSGLVAAAERDGRTLAPERDDLYGGLLTTLLRLVFMLYAEDHRDSAGAGLLPVENPLYQEHLSVHGLFAELQADADRYPDTMDRRFGAWPRLVAAFRSIYDGAGHGALAMPPRRGDLFDPTRHPFLEGWSAVAPLGAVERAAVRVPSISDGTVYGVLRRLLILGDGQEGRGQRLAYRSLDVEQIGSVYERVMGYAVVATPGRAVCLRPGRVWVAARTLLAEAPGRRAAWLVDHADVDKTAVRKVGAALKAARDEEALFEALAPLVVKGSGPVDAGALVLQPGSERRRTSSHYTPRSLTEPVVRRTLEPLLAAMKEKNGGQEPTSAQLLALKVCDPAMGSGAFLVAACRYLADQVVAAWTREGNLEAVASADEDATVRARRLVAQRCLYGVDKNQFAVSLAKLSLWLATLAKKEPLTFVDHALKHGDSLVGLDLRQLQGGHWAPTEQLPLFKHEVEEGIKEARKYREKILALAGQAGPEVTRQKEDLLRDADDAIVRAKRIADVVVGAFFSAGRDKEREEELARRRGIIDAWADRGQECPTELVALQAELRRTIPAFHWLLEFPEVFYVERPDPLAATDCDAKVDAFVGNMPFAGKNLIAEAHGPLYGEWLKTIHAGSHGNADLSAHFFRRCDGLLGRNGTLGLLATNTIAQGDTRTSGLKPIVAGGAVIYEAVSSSKWPGESNVAFSLVHIAKGTPARGISQKRLDGLMVDAINSRLRPSPERADPVPLQANADLSFQGSIVLGMGFTFDDDNPEATRFAEMERLIKKSKRNGERIFPYLGGEEVNTSPTQSPHRYVINFGDMSLEEVRRWPDLLAIVEEKVKPERDKNKREIRRKYWWRFGETTPALYEALKGRTRCLVTSRVSKHLMFAWQPVDRVFADALYVFAFEDNARFGVLQSRIHECWARLLASSMRNDLRYAASDCFETFPFPLATRMSPTSDLERLGKALDAARALLMVARNHGLTVLYNQLKDADCEDPEIISLRRLHEELDRAVLAAYGWSDIAVPPFVDLADPAVKQAKAAFSDAILDRLFSLNAERAAGEAATPSLADVQLGERRSCQTDLSPGRRKSDRVSAASGADSGSKHRRATSAKRAAKPKGRDR